MTDKHGTDRPTRILEAELDPWTAENLDRVAVEDGTDRDRLVIEAIHLYCSLPPQARRAVGILDRQGDNSELGQAITGTSRSLRYAAFRTESRCYNATLPDLIGPPISEEMIDQEADRMIQETAKHYGWTDLLDEEEDLVASAMRDAQVELGLDHDLEK